MISFWEGLSAELGSLGGRPNIPACLLAWNFSTAGAPLAASAVLAFLEGDSLIVSTGT